MRATVSISQGCGRNKLKARPSTLLGTGAWGMPDPGQELLMRSYKNKGVACGGSAPLRLRGRGAVGVGRGGSGDRRTAPEGPWEPGLRRVPRTDPKESSSHRDASSCRPVQRGHLLFSLKGAPRPPRAGRMGGAERQHSRGCSSVCINLSLFAPFTVFPCCLSVFQSLSVSVPPPCAAPSLPCLGSRWNHLGEMIPLRDL